jgi:co-chaperonin GroES (HSP10)
MKHLNNRILLNKIDEESKWGEKDPEELNLGEIAFDYKSESNDLKAGDKVFYENAREIKVEGQPYLLVREQDLICQK